MAEKRTVYFDNAATSFPKPAGVAEAILKAIREIGANPGRSGHRLSVDAARVIFNTREIVARLFNIEDPNRCIFTANATEAINIALKGLLRAGDHAITTGMEHNSVMRPLRALEQAGVGLTVVQCSPDGKLDPDDLARAILPNTKIAVINHASNVNGNIQPVREIGRLCRDKSILLLADCAQTAGCLPIDITEDNIDLLAFTGHKGLLGPQGTGGLILGSRVDITKIAPLKQGGTGSRSEIEFQPDFLPDMFEAGTPNTPGIAGLGAGVEFVLAAGVEKIRDHERTLVRQLVERLKNIKGVEIAGDSDPDTRVATVSFNISGHDPSVVGFRLDDEYGVLCRTGLHCAPAAHRTLGTFPKGAVRFGLSYFSTEEEIDIAINAVADIANGA